MASKAFGINTKSQPIDFYNIPRTESEIENQENEIRMPNVTPATLESQRITQMNMVINQKLFPYSIIISVISIILIVILILLILFYLDYKNNINTNELFKTTTNKNLFLLNQYLVQNDAIFKNTLGNLFPHD